jgi:hypothetical protein
MLNNLPRKAESLRQRRLNTLKAIYINARKSLAAKLQNQGSWE